MTSKVESGARKGALLLNNKRDYKQNLKQTKFASVNPLNELTK